MLKDQWPKKQTSSCLRTSPTIQMAFLSFRFLNSFFSFENLERTSISSPQVVFPRPGRFGAVLSPFHIFSHTRISVVMTTGGIHSKTFSFLPPSFSSSFFFSLPLSFPLSPTLTFFFFPPSLSSFHLNACVYH